MPAPVVVETPRFPEDIARGAVGGPRFKTIVTTTDSGGEQRSPRWSRARWYFDVAQGLRSPAQGQTLEAFFLAVMGRANGFRFKDWGDYTATNEPLVETGAPTVQLIKTYTFGALSYVRTIYKPVSGVTLRKNGSNLGGISTDTTTGLVTLPVVITKSITAITQASSAVVTVGASHGFATNDLVYISGVVGMTQINGQVGTVTATGANTITVNINSTSYTAYTSGGTAVKYLTTTDVLDATFEFDIPMRLDVDEFEMEYQDVGIRNWQRIPLVELP